MRTIKSLVGVDIGSNSIRLVALNGSSRPKVFAYSEVEIPSNVFTTNAIKEKEKIIISLKTAIENVIPNKITPHFASTALPESVVFTKIISLPSMRKRELNGMIDQEISQVLPRPLEEMEIDYQILGSSESQMDVLVIAADKNLVLDVLEIFNSVGLNLVRLETKPACLGRIVVDEKKNPLVLVDIGAHVSSVAIYDYGQIRVTATVTIGGDAWKEAIKNSLSEESQVKNEKTPDAYDFTPTLSVIIEEVENAIHYYQNRSLTARPVQEVILAGGGSELVKIANFFDEKLQLPTSKAKGQVILLPGMNNRYLIAAGTALDPPV